jgi:hypothetical protein
MTVDVRISVDDSLAAEALRPFVEALGIDDHGHPWDDDPAAWVKAQRSTDPQRTG